MDSQTLNIRIQKDLYAALKKKAEENNISLASIVRLACTEYLNKK